MTGAKATGRWPASKTERGEQDDFRWNLLSRSIDHDLIGKPVPDFPDHALVGIQRRPQGLIRQQVIKIGDRLN